MPQATGIFGSTSAAHLYQSAKVKFPADRILLIATRQIGDVLLCTPLLRSIRIGYPNAQIDMLVYSNKGGMLEGNPDLHEVIEVDEHPPPLQYLAFVRRIFRRYDLVVSTQGGDRPFIYAWLSAPRRVSIIPALRWQDAWKRHTAQAWCLLDNEHTHTVLQNLQLADALGIARHFELVPPSNVGADARLSGLLPFAWPQSPYVVLHPMPMWRYKRWTEKGWLHIAQYVLSCGYRVVLTGGLDRSERAAISNLARALNTAAAVDVSGKLTFGQLACLLRQCCCYVGPDTAVTHLAAACGAPTVAIFGPTNPVKWGPWPHKYTFDKNPFVRSKPLQRQGNVLLVQGVGACVPCQNEGCQRHKQSGSRCLDELPSETVISGLAGLLAG